MQYILSSHHSRAVRKLKGGKGGGREGEKGRGWGDGEREERGEQGMRREGEGEGGKYLAQQYQL